MKDILVIITGGTIDAESYEDTPSKVHILPKSLVPGVLEELKADNCEIKLWKMKDSKDFSALELAELAEFVHDSGYKKIIITHGTDAMVDNAKVLKTFFTKNDSVIIFTGAMEPLSHGIRSDGKNNLAYSIQQIEKVPPGTYIVGREELAGGKLAPGIFEVEGAKKNFLKKIFERLGSA